MFESAEIVRMSKELAQHAGARQAEIARNIANADTPGYRARDLKSFDEVYSQPAGIAPKATRAGHNGALSPEPLTQTVIDARTEPSPNGNSVSVETEMMKAAEVRQSHELAITVYRTSLDLMRTVLGRGR